MIGFSGQSQEVKKKKNAKVSFEVDGICGMCKKRIETAALKSKGVKFAIWSVKTHQLSVILDERKTDVKKIQKNIRTFFLKFHYLKIKFYLLTKNN